MIKLGRGVVHETDGDQLTKNRRAPKPKARRRRNGEDYRISHSIRTKNVVRLREHNPRKRERWGAKRINNNSQKVRKLYGDKKRGDSDPRARLEGLGIISNGDQKQ